MTYFEYEVKVYQDDELTTLQGVTVGNSYPEAIQTVLDYYGLDVVSSIKLEEWDCDGCLEMTAECLRQLREDDPYAP